MYEQPLIDRRRLLVWALQAGAGGLLLPGCGGSDDADSGDAGSGPVTEAGPPLDNAAVMGSVLMPAGASVMPGIAGNAFSQGAVTGSLQFPITVIRTNRLLTVANGPGGGALLSGFLSDTQTELSARTTAVVLAFEALGGSLQIEAVRLLLLDELDKPGAVAALEAAVAAAIVARGEGWLDTRDAALAQALGDLVTSFRTAPASLHKAAQGAIVDPTARQSGLQVNADGVGSAVVANYFRRRVYLYTERVSYRDSSGMEFSSKGLVGAQPLKLGAVKGLGSSLNVLADLYAGNKDYYDPTLSEPLSVPVEPATATSTRYSIRGVGLSTGPNKGELDALSTIQKAGWIEVSTQTLVLDLVLPIIANIVLPIAGQSIDDLNSFNGSAGVTKDIITACSQSAEISLKIQEGAIGEAVTDAILTIVNSDTLRSGLIQMLLDWVVARYPGSAKLSNQEARLFAFNFADKLTKFVGAVDVGFAIFDAAVASCDLARSDAVTTFTLDVTNAKAALNPQTARTDAIGVPIVFTAAVVNADLTPDTVLSYTWETTGHFGDISDGLPEHTGASFESSRGVLSYVPNGKGSPGDSDTITVRIYKGGVFASRIPIGEAMSTVTYRRPYSLSISPGATSDFPTETDMGLSAFINEALPAGTTVAWNWSHGGVGSIVASPADSNPADSDVTFSSTLQEGAATVTVRATVNVPATPQAPALSFDTDPVQAGLSVKKGLTTITFEVGGGTFACVVPEVCGVGVYTGFVVPKFAKALEYKAVMSGFGIGNPYYDAVGNTRTQIWNAPVPDRGGIFFPVTDFPHGAPNTKFWCVWNPVDGKCVVTVTLKP